MAGQALAPSQLSFITLCLFFEHVSGLKGSKRSREVQLFMRKHLVRPSNDLFSVLRLLLPQDSINSYNLPSQRTRCWPVQLDNKRGNYLLKETSLAKTLCLACRFDPKTPSGQAAIKYKEGRNAGFFAKTMREVLFTASCGVQDGPERTASEAERRLKVADLNKALDELTRPENKKFLILTELVQICSPRMMFWTTKIILKDMKLGVSEKTVLREFHKDAMDLHDVCQDLERVCKELQDPSIRAKRRDIEPGKGSIKPQLAEKVFSVEQAFSKMSKPKEFRIDIKLDGERIQLHRMGDKLQYWSRNNKDHAVQSSYSVMNAVAARQIKPESCILDGEFIVWNKSRKRFEPFGNLKHVVLGARDALPADHKVNTAEINTADPDYLQPVLGELCLTYVVFDILFLEPDGSVIKRSLKERQQILKEAIKPAPPSGHPLKNLWAAVVVQAPGETILNHTEPSCRIGHTVEDIQSGYEHALSLGESNAALQEEGVVVKDLHSEWQVNDRSGAWLKIKPDHTHAADVDCLIIGAMLGEGRHGGKVSQYLLALAEEPKNGQDNPHTFHSFCKVGTGLTDRQQDQVRERLQPYLEPNTRKNVPKCYKVTGRPQERPDFWVTDPYQSLVLKVTADIRSIQSKEFFTYHSLRFPRVVDNGIRWDKGAADIETTEHFNRMLMDMKGTFLGQGGTPEDAFAQGNRTSRKRQQKQARKQAASVAVVPHLLAADVEGTKVECPDVLENKSVAVVNYGPDSSKQDLEELVKKLGGTMHMCYIGEGKNKTDYLVAGSKEGPYAASFKRYRVKPMSKPERQRAILSIGWLRDCLEAQEFVQPRPCHYLNLPKEELANMPNMGKYGLSRYGNIDATDVACSLNNHADLKDIDVHAISRSAYAKSVLGEVAGQLPVPGTQPARALRASDEDRVLLLVDTVLQENGLADSSVSLFRARTLCFVDLPKPSADAPARASPPPASGTSLDAEDAEVDAGASQAVPQVEPPITQNTLELHQCKLERLKLQVQLAGGHVTERITDATTHVVAVPAPGDQLRERHPEKLLSAVSEQAGGKSALIIMQRLLKEKALDVVLLIWVEAALDDLNIHPVAAMLPEAEAHIVPLVTNEEVMLEGNPDEGIETREVHTYRVDRWPWGLFGLGEASTGKRSRGQGSRSRSSADKAQSGGEGAVDQPPTKKARRKAAPAANNSPLSVAAKIQKSRPAGRRLKRKPIPEQEIDAVEAGPQLRQGKPDAAEAEDWLGPPLIKEEPPDPSKRARVGAVARLPTSVATSMEAEDLGVGAGAPTQAQGGRSRAAGAAASSARMGHSTGRSAAQAAAPGAAAEGARSDGGGAALPAAPGAAGSSGGGQQAAPAPPAKPAPNSLLMAILQGDHYSDVSDAEATPRAAQGPPPVPTPVNAVPASAPAAAPDLALADAGPAAAGADAGAHAQPAVAPPADPRPARPRVTSAGRTVNLFEKYGKRQR